MTAKRVATYLRVSTKHHGQNLDTQRLALQENAKNRGFEIVAEYADHGVSGSKDRRPELDRLMRDARARKFDAVLLARFDRFSANATGSAFFSEKLTMWKRHGATLLVQVNLAEYYHCFLLEFSPWERAAIFFSDLLAYSRGAHDNRAP